MIALSKIKIPLLYIAVFMFIIISNIKIYKGKVSKITPAINKN
jgi:hypothetical protein